MNDTDTKVNGILAQTASYTYDFNGNQLQTTTINYVSGQAQPAQITVNTYDLFNQQKTTTMPDGKLVENSYNGDGIRVSKTFDGQTTRYLYEFDKVILETDAEGNEKARNVYGTNLLYRKIDGQILSYMYNGHADVTALLDTQGNIVASYYYDAFGNPVTDGTNEGNLNNPIRYAGYQWDSETGLYYLNARYYDPKIARFLTEDTYRGEKEDPLTLNLYTYCLNDPIKYTDPTGHDVGGRSMRMVDYANGMGDGSYEPTDEELLGAMRVSKNAPESEKVQKLAKVRQDANNRRFARNFNKDTLKFTVEDSFNTLVKSDTNHVMRYNATYNISDFFDNKVSEQQYAVRRGIYGVSNDNNFANDLYDALPDAVRYRVDLDTEKFRSLKESNPALYDTKYADTVLNYFDATKEHMEMFEGMDKALKTKNPAIILGAAITLGGIRGSKTKLKDTRTANDNSLSKEFRKASLRDIKRKLGVPMSQQPVKQEMVPLR